MSVRPLSQEDLRPYMIPARVIAVRLFRQQRGIWLAGALKEIKLNDDVIRFRLGKFIQIEPYMGRSIYPQNPSERLFAHFRVVKTDVSYNGIRGDDYRPFECSDPQLIESDSPTAPDMISIQSNKHGTMILSFRENDLRDLEILFAQLNPRTEKVSIAQ